MLRASIATYTLLFSAAASLASLLATPSAAAQDAPTVAILAVGGTVGVDASAWTEASDAIEARLREAGYRIDDSGLPRRDDCSALPCLREERASRDIDVLVTLTIFAAEGATDSAGSVVVTMVDADGQYVGEERVEGRVVGVVAALALASARSARERGPEPWVRVSGSPPGAVVLIDGREVGVVPFEGRVEAGDHQLTVRLGGYASFERRFVARNGSTETVEVALERGSSGGGPSGAEIAGIALSAAGAVGGAVLIGVGASWMSSAGMCATGPSMPPCAGEYFTPGAGEVAIGVGAAMVGTAAITTVLILALD